MHTTICHTLYVHMVFPHNQTYIYLGTLVAADNVWKLIFNYVICIDIFQLKWTVQFCVSTWVPHVCVSLFMCYFLCSHHCTIRVQYWSGSSHWKIGQYHRENKEWLKRSCEDCIVVQDTKAYIVCGWVQMVSVVSGQVQSRLESNHCTWFA